MSIEEDKLQNQEKITDKISETLEESNTTKDKEYQQLQYDDLFKPPVQGFLFTLQSKFFLVLLLFGFFGILLIFIAILIENGGKGLDGHILIPFLKEMGILLFAVVTTTLVHERFLKFHSLKEIQKALTVQLQEVVIKSLPNEITKVISDQLPKNIDNLKKSGIIDAYPDLDTSKIYLKIKNLRKNSEVFILKIWLPSIDDLGQMVIEAIRKGCKIKIIIAHPDQLEVFEKRARFLQIHTSTLMKSKVLENIEKLKLIKDAIEKNTNISNEFKSNLEVRLHRDFVTVAIFGFDENILAGFYLHDNISENNVQLKIKGKDTKYYQSFKNHFETQWNSPNNETLENYLSFQSSLNPTLNAETSTEI